MSLLERLRKPVSVVSRSTLEDYIGWLQMAGFGGSFAYNGVTHPLGVQTSMPYKAAEPIGENFAGYVCGGLRANGIVWTCANVRLQVFSQARFMFQSLRQGRPGDLFGTAALARLEEPWMGGTTSDLLAQMLLHADFAGNAYVAPDDDGNLGLLRPDWTDIVLEQRLQRGKPVGWKRFGYTYYEGGHRDAKPTPFLADEVAHFAPYPDPLASFRGMSWLTPVLRELMADQSATLHKQRYFENSATPNLVVSGVPAKDPVAFQKWIDVFEEGHAGASNAGKTLYLTAGADTTVVGSTFQQLDFKNVQGGGETRIAAASGVGAIIAQFSEGMQGSSLNAGNYGAARRRFSDIPMRHAWQNAAGSLQVLVPPPAGARLWYDGRDIPFLQEDARDAADIEQTKAITLRQHIEAGFDPASAVAAVDAQDITLLRHTGKVSVQLQTPGSDTAPTEEPTNDDDDDEPAE